MRLLLAVFGILWTTAAGWGIFPKSEDAEACQQQFGISKEEFKRVQLKGPDAIGPKYDCYANCFLEKSGVIRDGAFTESLFEDIRELQAALRDMDNPEDTLVAETFIGCTNVVGIKKCELAGNFMRCVYPVLHRIA